MGGVLPFVASMLALPREPTTHHPLVQRPFVQVQTKPTSRSFMQKGQVDPEEVKLIFPCVKGYESILIIPI